MKVYEALVDACEAEGVGAVFGLMGDGNMLFMAEIAKRGTLPLHRTRHEGPALTMAAAHARASNRIGVATVTCGPGVTQLGTALVDATRGHAPVVVVAGDLGPHDGHINQWFPQQAFVESTGAAWMPLIDPATTADVVGEAFHRARTERRPVVLSVAMAVVDEVLPWAWDYRPSVGVRTGPAPAPLDAGAADSLAARLAGAERPVILAGAGAIGDGVSDLLGHLAEATGALLATTLRAKGLFDGMPYAVGIAGAFATRPARELFAEADLVIAFGASLNYFTTEGGYLFPQADVVSIDLGIAKHRKELDVETHAADCALAAEALLARVQAATPRGYRATPLDLEAVLRPSELDRPTATGAVIHPVDATRELDRLLGDDAAFVIGVGHFWSFPIMYLHGRGAHHYHVTYDFGAIGQALPAGIGFLAARPAAPTVVIEGDGSLLMQVQELDTLSRMSGPLLVVVMNDGAYSAETHKLRAKGHPEDSAVFGAPDLASVSTALGVPGRRVTDLESLRAGVEEFLRLRQPFLLDVRISAEVVSAPFLRTIFGEDA